MKTKTILLTAFLVSALFLISGCKSNTKPSGTDTKSTTETMAAEAADDETTEPDSGSKGKGPLEVRSGIIEYSYSGDKTGKSTQYFDDYGVKSAVYAEIVQQGKESKGWGESKPLDTNATAEGKANNRRVEFVKM